MIKKGILVKKSNGKKQLLHGILLGGSSSSSKGEHFLSWDIVKVAKFGHHLVPFYVTPASGSASKENLALQNHSRFCVVKKIGVKGSVSQGSLIKKVLKSLAKRCAAMAVIMDTNRENTLQSLISFAKYCTDQLPETTAILVIQKEKIISTKRSVFEQKGFRLNSRPEFYLKEKSTSLGEDLVFKNTESRGRIDDNEELNNQNVNPNMDCEEKVNFRTISFIRKELPESVLGWPLLPRTSKGHEVSSRCRERNMSVVEWAMSLPSRSTSLASQENMIDWNGNKTNISVDRESDNFHPNDPKFIGDIHSAEDESTDGNRNSEGKNLNVDSGHKEEVSNLASLLKRKLSLSKPGWPLLRVAAPIASDSSRESEDRSLANGSTPGTPQSQISLVSQELVNSFDGDENHLIPSTERPRKLELLLEFVSSNIKQFTHKELERATCQFSSDNLIGEGGSSNVYKGCLPDGKLVAVKVLRPYKEAWNDFSLEAAITSSLKHENITPLIGVCIEDNNLVLVYDFLPKGSLEESLHGIGKKSVLPLEVRFKVAIAIAEALNYLHNECQRPVIHRDVKSSNILLSTEFQPQLSDFGLAIWGPTDSAYIIHEDVVGTFGYIAPEYFMHGKVSNKIDIYSFGVVLLELLSGRRPISSKSFKGQESLVKWAKPMLDSGDAEALLDPNLNDFDVAQMQRMMLAASLCINQSPGHRPKISQILRLLRREEDEKEWVDSSINDAKELSNPEDDDDLLLEIGGTPRLDFSILEAGFDVTSFSSVDTASLLNAEQKQRLKLSDYLKQEQD